MIFEPLSATINIRRIWQKNPESRKNPAKRALVLGLFLVLFWAWNNFALRVNSQTVYSPKVKEPFRVAVVSDLHDSVLASSVVRRMKKLNPDLIFLPGDLYTNDGHEKAEKAVGFAGSLARIAPTYFVCGDHDHEPSYYKMLEADGVTVLDGRCEKRNIRGNELSIYGICRVWFLPEYSLFSIFPEPDKARMNLLLSHMPAMEHFADFAPDFVFSGDSHGGIVRLPLLGALSFDGVLLPKLFYNGPVYDKGWFSVGGSRLFVTSGVGSYPVALRLFNRPEIALITFKGEEK